MPPMLKLQGGQGCKVRAQHLLCALCCEHPAARHAADASLYVPYTRRFSFSIGFCMQTTHPMMSGLHFSLRVLMNVTVEAAMKGMLSVRLRLLTCAAAQTEGGCGLSGMPLQAGHCSLKGEWQL